MSWSVDDPHRLKTVQRPLENLQEVTQSTLVAVAQLWGFRHALVLLKMGHEEAMHLFHLVIQQISHCIHLIQDGKTPFKQLGGTNYQCKWLWVMGWNLASKPLL